jgi:2,3-bisphosphoglycerate-independent phosphoglycerate mutase
VKYVVCVPDGASDEPVPELGDRTPLEAAHLPTLARLARVAVEVGRAATIPPGFPPGSDVGNMSIFGYDPARYHTGRAPIEAAALGIDIGDDQVAFRCNLVTVDATTNTMVDLAGGHPTTEQAAEVIADLQQALGDDDVSFHPGVQYRHILLAPKDWADADCVPPHDLTDKPAVWPTGPASAHLQRLMDASREIVPKRGLKANQIWLWGQGARPRLPRFVDTYGLDAGLVSAVDLVRGLGALTDVECVDVEGATGWYDTNYEGTRDAAIDALANGGKDLFLIHVEASDEAGHAGDVQEKVNALENWDRRILGPLVDAMDGVAPDGWRLLLLPDHPTPLRLKTHTGDAVPYLLYDSTAAQSDTGGVYTEAATAGATPVPGHELMARLTLRR